MNEAATKASASEQIDSNTARIIMPEIDKKRLPAKYAIISWGTKVLNAAAAKAPRIKNLPISTNSWAAWAKAPTSLDPFDEGGAGG